MAMPENAPNRDQIAAEVDEQFRALDEAGAKNHPGLNDLLQAYGAYEAAAKQADAYLAILNPPPTFSSTDSSK